ncbi:hypothetical protein T11_11968 [Trichinella zimbabwensis]|uniref:Uncharacterized protein n=1 Tax=Trichinella zimbabwensis TaxID=268475 RepID=A0A0V1I6D7_9BILA|nr:hypothetical protein T11_11968 [Trichinella zimbabwensis]
MLATKSLPTESGLYLMIFVRVVQIYSQPSRRVGRWKENDHNDLDGVQIYCDSGQDKLNSNERIATTSDCQQICESQAHQLTLRVVLLIPRRTCVGVFPRGVTLL